MNDPVAAVSRSAQGRVIRGPKRMAAHESIEFLEPLKEGVSFHRCSALTLQRFRDAFSLSCRVRRRYSQVSGQVSVREQPDKEQQ